MTIEDTECLTIKKAAEISGVTKAAIFAAISRNKLKAQGFYNPHCWLIDPKKLEEYIKKLRFSEFQSKKYTMLQE